MITKIIFLIAKIKFFCYFQMKNSRTKFFEKENNFKYLFIIFNFTKKILKTIANNFDTKMNNFKFTKTI